MKKLLIKWFGEVWYCDTFHTKYEFKGDLGTWHCLTCGSATKKKFSHGNMQPK